MEKRVTEYAFIQKEIDREISSKGEVKKETTKVYEVFPVTDREPITKLVARTVCRFPVNVQRENQARYRGVSESGARS